jgi:hypothetical protein
LRTAATSEELISATQALLAPGLGAGMSIDQITTLTVTGVNAVKSVGLQSYQVVQELRDLVAGGIQPASSTLATALGLKDSDIQKAKASSQGLYAFLMERLRGFEIASGEYAKTWRGITDQLQEGTTRAGAMGMNPLFSAIKSEMAGLVEKIVNVDEVTKKVTINPELVAGIRSASTTAVVFAGEMKSLGQSIWSVAQPIGSILVPGIKMAAEHARELTVAVGGWMLLKQVSMIYADVSLAMAGSATAQTFLGKAVIETNMRLSEQAARAALAGAAVRDAALLASLGQKQLSSAVLLTNMALMNKGTAAVAAGAQTASAMAVAGTAVRGLLSGVWALVGGWVGVAAAISYAIYKLWEFKDERNKTGYWEQPSGEGTTGGRGRGGRPKFIRYADIDRVGANAFTMTPQEVAAYKAELDQKELQAKMDAVVGKFAGTKDGKGAEKAYEEEQRLRDKIADMVAKMNAKIREDTQTTYEANASKLADEIANTKRDLDKSALDFAKYGIDVSGVYTKIGEYQGNQLNKFAKEQSRELESVKIETMAANAEITGDYEKAAEAQYQAAVLSIRKQAEERRLKAGNTTAVVDWEVQKIREAEQKKLQSIADGDNKKYAMRLQYLEFQRQQGQISSEYYRTEYAKEVDLFLESNQKKLSNVEAFSVEWQNRMQAALAAEEVKHKLAGQNMSTAWKEANLRMSIDTYDYAGRIVQTWQEAGSSISSGLLNAFKGTGDGILGIFSSISDSVLKMMIDMTTQMYLMNPMKNMFSSLLVNMGGGLNMSGGGAGIYADSFSFPTHANGGIASGWSVVGERGIELVNFSRPGRVYTADQTRDALSGSSRDSGRGGNMTLINNQYITAPNPSSFRQSSGQIASDAARGLNRNMRRNG